MFKRSVMTLSEIINMHLRQNGLETPLLQNRVIDAWDSVAGEFIGKYTADKFIKNQVLFVKITNPALRSDLSMMRTRLINKLNQTVGSRVIVDIRIF